MTPTEHEIKAINIRLATYGSVRKSARAWAESHGADYTAARAEGRLVDAEYAARARGQALARVAEAEAKIRDLLSQRRRIAGI